MTLKVASLGSGSKGNATLVSNGETTFLIDCGFTLKETKIRLQRFSVDPQQLSGILVTHEHQDHIKGVGPLSRKYKLPIWTTRGTFLSGKCGKIDDLRIIRGFSHFEVEGIKILPITVPHDAREPCQFIFEWQGQRLGIISDLGSYTPTIVDHLSSCQTLLLECNHDQDMLWTGEYPYHLKKRVGGDFGHLSNQQAKQLLSSLKGNNLQLLVATHLSEQNNCPKKVKRDIALGLDWQEEQVLIASQTTGLDWLTVNT